MVTVWVPPYKSGVYGVWLLWRLGWYLLVMYLALAFIKPKKNNKKLKKSEKNQTTTQGHDVGGGILPQSYINFTIENDHVLSINWE